MEKKKFLYPYNPGIKVIYNKVRYGRGNSGDLEIISSNFVLVGSPLLQANADFITDDSVSYLNKKRCYVARKSGFVYYNENQIQILPYIGVNDEKFISYIIIPTSEFCSRPLTETSIAMDIDASGFKNKVSGEVAKECFKIYKKSGGYKVIYRGEKMIPDRVDDILLDDRFSFHEENFTLLEGRRILSNKEVEFYHLVNQGERVGVFKKLIPGKEGEDVYGDPIPQTQIKSFYKVGEGLKQNSNGEIVALQNGILRINLDGKMTVKDTKVISRDVKSNLEIEGAEDVIIAGRIYSNVNIKLEGSLIILGSVEEIHIDCGGDLLISHGINNQSVIEVGGDCLFQFISHSELVTKGQVWVGQYTLNSSIKAQKNVVVRNKQFGEIVGGTVESEMGAVETNTIGSISGISTLIKVGKEASKTDETWEAKVVLKKYSNEKFLLEQKFNKVKQFVEHIYLRWKKEPESLSNKERVKFKESILIYKHLREELRVLEEKIEKAEQIVASNTSSKVTQNQIKVFGGVFGGVSVQIKNVKYYFKYNQLNALVLRKKSILPKIEISALES